MRNRMYGGVRGRKTKVGEKLLRFPPTRLFLKVNSEIELEGSIARFVETVVADVGKTDVVGEIGIEHVVADAAADADTTIKAAEVCILE